MAADRWGRGDVEGASCQPPVGGRQWWCCVSGVGGNRHGGVAYLTHGVIRCPGYVWLLLLLGSHGRLLGSCHGGSHLLGGCHCLAAGVVFSGGGCMTWHGDSVLRWWWLGVEE